MNLLTHPLFRPVLAILTFVFAMQALRATWVGKSRAQVPLRESHQDRLVVAHFMLGNTYPFTENDWMTTFDLAEDTSLDGFALNLGPEDWQLSQAHSAYQVLSSRHSRKRPFRMFLSLDMNVLPSQTAGEAEQLLEKVVGLMRRDGYLRYQGRLILSTFGGHDKTFGGMGWEGFLSEVQQRLGERIMFIPSFFMPPDDFLRLPYVDGCFGWNNAWPLDNRTTDLREDEVFLSSNKVYMAAVSPLFSTHYGTTGEFAYNKNWIYRSDDLLLPTRFSQLINLPPHRSPQIIQVISFNDHGESHSIAPVLGAEPGSQSWTKGMDHEAFREMVRYFAEIWRDGATEVGEREIKIWSWYRTHPASARTEVDEVGRPDHSDWASDLLNFMVLAPTHFRDAEMVISNGPKTYRQRLNAGKANALTVPFVPGPVSFELYSGGNILSREHGRDIDGEIEKYNFNMWTGAWRLVYEGD